MLINPGRRRVENGQKAPPETAALEPIVRLIVDSGRRGLAMGDDEQTKRRATIMRERGKKGDGGSRRRTRADLCIIE